MGKRKLEGKKFSSEYQPVKNGRKPDKLKKFIEDNGLSSNDIAAAIKYILPLNEEEIVRLGQDKGAPMLMRLFVKAIISDIQGGQVVNIMSLLNRVYGAPKQEIEHTTNKDSLDALKKLYS